jgi:hypothetical protein
LLTISIDENSGLTESRGIEQPWTLEVHNAITGELKLMRSETSEYASVSTTGWSKGIYIVKVTYGNEELTQKIVLK